MSKTVRGPFHVKMSPLALENLPPDEKKIGRMGLEKTYEGALAGSGVGQMMAAHTEVAGSAAYVAVERIDGVLDGKSGTFVIVHTGLMDQGTPSLTISVVPDSGTGELEGLTGTMDIIREPEHEYVFTYSLGEKSSPSAGS